MDALAYYTWFIAIVGVLFCLALAGVLLGLGIFVKVFWDYTRSNRR